MKRLFFTLLVSIVSITLLLVAIIGGAIILNFNHEEIAFRQQAYEEYVSYIQEQLTVENLLYFKRSYSNIKLNLESYPDERISGIIFRNDQDQFIFGIGTTPKGIPVNSIEGYKLIEEDKNISVPDTIFDIQDTINEVNVNVRRTQQDLDFVLPEFIQNHDIVGAVTINVNDEKACTIYVLTHNLRTYAYSMSVVNKSIKVLGLGIVFGIVFSLVVAWTISYRNTKMVTSIQMLLKEVTDESHTSLSFPTDSPHFAGKIYESIRDLDNTLNLNKRNRYEWLRSISHDLNTPVTSLLITLEAIEDKIYDGNDPEVIKKLLEEARILESRIKLITEYSKLDTLSQTQREEIDTKTFVEEVLKSFEQTQRERIRTIINAQTINADKSLLSRASFELLKNALCASTDEVIWTIDQSKLSFLNKGKLKKDIDYLAPWTKGDWSRANEGSGMGLPIVSSIARLHKGQISLFQKDEDTVEAILTINDSLD